MNYLADTYGDEIHLDLFTGPDSAPFQWRVRACEGNGTDCGPWSNTVNWAAAACARRQ